MCKGWIEWLCAAGSSGIWVFRLFKGYDWVTVMVVANLAFSGLLVSWVMKFADSILKVRSLACGSLNHWHSMIMSEMMRLNAAHALQAMLAMLLKSK